MNSLIDEQIPIEQNSQKQLERLAAQRELYSSGKKWYVAQIVLTVVIPVISAMTSIYLTELAIFSAIFGVCVFVFDISIIDPEINKKKIKAAKIQNFSIAMCLKFPNLHLK